jgi:hypothetical protein
MTDNDLNEVRRFRAALDQPTADSVLRVRRRLTTAIEGPASPVPLMPAEPRRRGRWVLAASGAAAAVAAVIAAAAIGLPSPDAPGGTTQFGGPPGGGAQSGGTPGGGAQSGSLPSSPVSPLATAPASEAWPADLRATVERLAQLGAQLQPITVPAGKVLHNGSTIDERSGAHNTHEVWYDVDGVITLRVKRTGFHPMDVSMTEAEIAQTRQGLATNGPSLAQPSPAYLAGLPTDPARLLTALLPDRSDKEGARSPEHYLFKDYVQVFYYLQPVLQPATRQAFYRMLGRMAGVRTLGALDIGGQPYVVIGHDERNRDGAVETSVLLFDRATGKVVGDGYVIGGQLETVARWAEPEVGDAPPPGVGSDLPKKG